MNRNLRGYRGPDTNADSNPALVAAFKDVIQGKRSKDQARAEYVRRIQEMRRSSIASPVNRNRPRGTDKRRAIREQD